MHWHRTFASAPCNACAWSLRSFLVIMTFSPLIMTDVDPSSSPPESSNMWFETNQTCVRITKHKPQHEHLGCWPLLLLASSLLVKEFVVGGVPFAFDVAFGVTDGVDTFPFAVAFCFAFTRSVALGVISAFALTLGIVLNITLYTHSWHTLIHTCMAHTYTHTYDHTHTHTLNTTLHTHSHTYTHAWNTALHETQHGNDIACMHNYCWQLVLCANLDEVDSQDAWCILRMMPRMYLAIKDLDLVAATWPCLQDMPMVAILPTASSLA